MAELLLQVFVTAGALVTARYPQSAECERPDHCMYRCIVITVIGLLPSRPSYMTILHKVALIANSLPHPPPPLLLQRGF